MDRKGNAWLTVFIVFALLAVLGGVGYVAMNIGGTTNQAVETPNPSEGVPTGDCGQNPTLSYAFTNALTGQSVTASATNFKDKVSGNLLGIAPSLAKGQVVTPLINASGYISAVQKDYTVGCGNQQIQGKLYQFANETIKLYNDAGTGQIGGTLGSTGNDTKFTTQANNKLVLTGNTYKTTGKMFVVYEIGTTTNVSDITLTLNGASSSVSKVAVPNCYTNTLSGTPFRVAWEIPAIVGGTQVTYNLQTTAQSGNTVQGQALLTIYNEKAGVDSLTGDFLESGICDSNNAFFNHDKQINTFYFQ